MEKQETITPSILRVAVGTVALLLIPAVAMQFTNEVDWGVGDFIIMGLLLFGIGLSYVLITKFATNIIYKAATGLALGSTLFMIWANLGVGLIGSGPNAGNLMYIGVVAVVIIGTLLSGFRTAGMERAMYATVLSLVLHTVIALVANMDEYPGSSVIGIVGVNGLFVVLFVISGVLFRIAPPPQSSADNPTA